MMKFKKDYISKIVNVMIVGIFIINTAAYGYALPNQSSLRVPLTATNYEGQKRLKDMTEQLILREASIRSSSGTKKSVVRLGHDASSFMKYLRLTGQSLLVYGMTAWLGVSPISGMINIDNSISSQQQEDKKLTPGEKFKIKLQDFLKGRDIGEIHSLNPESFILDSKEDVDLINFLKNETKDILYFRERDPFVEGKGYKWSFIFFPLLSLEETNLLFSLGFVNEMDNRWDIVAYNLSKTSDPEKTLALIQHIPAIERENIESLIETYRLPKVSEKIGNYVVKAIDWALANGFAGEIGLVFRGGGREGDFFHGHIYSRNENEDDFIIIYHSQEERVISGGNPYKRSFFQNSRTGYTPIDLSIDGERKGRGFEVLTDKDIGKKEDYLLRKDFVFLKCPDGDYEIIENGKKIRINIYDESQNPSLGAKSHKELQPPIGSLSDILPYRNIQWVDIAI